MRNELLLAAAAVLLCACSTANRAVVRATTDVLARGRPATLDEPDFDLAREAMPSQLKLLETLLSVDPNNQSLRRLAAESFAGEAFLFLEDSSPARAKKMYRRGREQALASLALKPPFAGLSDMNLDSFQAALAKASPDDVPDLFWAAFNWAGELNLSKDDAAALAEVPRAVALMTRVSELDASFHFNGADVFFGVYYASRPPLLGGDPSKSKAGFERAHKATKGLYLMTHLLNARYYAVAVQDKELFTQLLRKVLDSPSGQLPEARLTDESAKRKAAALLEKIDEFF
jgi:hypothetical protein